MQKMYAFDGDNKCKREVKLSSGLLYQNSDNTMRIYYLIAGDNVVIQLAGKISSGSVLTDFEICDLPEGAECTTNIKIPIITMDNIIAGYLYANNTISGMVSGMRPNKLRLRCEQLFLTGTVSASGFIPVVFPQ